MASKKLTDADKQEILQLYRQPEETTLTLASRYGVSNSTISRFLKSTLPKSEYESLIQQKRTARAQSGVSEAEVEATSMPGATPSPEASPSRSGTPLRRKRKRPSVPNETSTATTVGDQWSVSPSPAAEEEASNQQLDLLFTSEETKDQSGDPGSAYEVQPQESDSESTQQWQESMAESFFGVGEDLDLEVDEEDFEDFEDEDFEGESAETEGTNGRRYSFSGTSRSPEDEIQILPLQAASFPKTCYLVVDRGSELIARPLREFSDLGKIPQPETDQIALPVFDNHRVARRFASRAQRVCKVPDAKLFQKVRPYLQAKGITRLLLNGQVYAV
jgi:transposase-like protein